VPVNVTIPTTVPATTLPPTVITTPDGQVVSGPNGPDFNSTTTVPVPATNAEVVAAMLHQLSADFVTAYYTVYVDDSLDSRRARVQQYCAPDLLKRLPFASLNAGNANTVTIDPAAVDGEDQGGHAFITVPFVQTLLVGGAVTDSVKRNVHLTLVQSGAQWRVADYTET
jgi:hypothetical protein